jgi:hypothetical protein
LLVVLHHHQAHSSDNSLVTDIAMVLYVFWYFTTCPVIMSKQAMHVFSV